MDIERCSDNDSKVDITFADRSEHSAFAWELVGMGRPSSLRMTWEYLRHPSSDYPLRVAFRAITIMGVGECLRATQDQGYEASDCADPAVLEVRRAILEHTEAT